MRFSNVERRRNIKEGEPFATKEDLKAFAKIWQNVAIQEYSGKPEYDEKDLAYYREAQDNITADPPEGQTRVEAYGDFDWLNYSPGKLLELFDGADSEMRDRA